MVAVIVLIVLMAMIMMRTTGNMKTYQRRPGSAVERDDNDADGDVNDDDNDEDSSENRARDVPKAPSL